MFLNPFFLLFKSPDILVQHYNLEHFQPSKTITFNFYLAGLGKNSFP